MPLGASSAAVELHDIREIQLQVINKSCMSDIASALSITDSFQASRKILHHVCMAMTSANLATVFGSAQSSVLKTTLCVQGHASISKVSYHT